MIMVIISPIAFLDAIYDPDDIEQLVYLHIWNYIGEYDNKKSSLKTYIIMLMKTVFYTCINLSNCEKRKVCCAHSLNKIVVNKKGDIRTLEDTLEDTTLPTNIDDNLSDFFYRQILRESYKRIYELVKEGYSYREISKKFHVSRQRIGQIMQNIGGNIRAYENRAHIKISKHN